MDTLAKKMIKIGINLDGNSSKDTVKNWIEYLKEEDKKRETKGNDVISIVDYKLRKLRK